VKIWKVIVATLVIFGAGVITGGLLVNHVVKIKKATSKPAAAFQVTTPWQQRNRDLLHRMERELDLTPPQRQRVEQIITDSQERTRALWKPIAPQMNKEMVRVREDIREELTPEQRKKFDELLKPRQRKMDEKSAASTNAVPASTAQSNSPASP
jgi:Spy/CpxP family protein refolding chaperone